VSERSLENVSAKTGKTKDEDDIMDQKLAR
jgi:hypothetical protein